MRANNFDGLRLLAALAVLFSHMSPLSGRPEPTVFPGFTFGAIGVLVFFSISGYLIAGSWHRDPDLGRFLAKRFLRLTPGIAVAIPLAFLATVAFGLRGFPDNPYQGVNGSLWTIPYEVYCYVIFVGGAMLLPRVSVLLATLYCFLAYHYSWHARSPLLDLGMFFTVGALLQAYPKLRSGRALVGFALAALVAHHEPRMALTLILPPLVVYIGSRSWPVLRSAGRYGDLSYGVYMYAWPVQQFMVVALGKDAPYLYLLLPTLAITICLAWLSWHYVEAPALARKPASYPGMPQLAA